MLKLIISFLLFFIIHVSLAQLSGTQKFPTDVEAGASFIMKVTIDRGKIDGFMKFSQHLPNGFTAINIDDKGGDFTFDKNEVKIIWLNPPAGESVYTISYKLTVPEDARGTKNLSGRIIYITKKNERRIFGFPAKKITVITKPVLQKAETTEVSESSKTSTPTLNMVSLIEKKDNDKAKTGNFRTKKAPMYVTVVEKMYRVQLGAFKVNPKIKGVLKSRDLGKRYSGNFSTYEAADEHKNKMIKEGYKDAFVVKFTTKVQVLKNDEYVLPENRNADYWDMPGNWSDCVTK